MKTKKIHVGWFSISKNGVSSYHSGIEQDPVYIAKTLTEHVTGGPYTVVKAFMEVELKGKNDCPN